MQLRGRTGLWWRRAGSGRRTRSQTPPPCRTAAAAPRTRACAWREVSAPREVSAGRHVSACEVRGAAAQRDVVRRPFIVYRPVTTVQATRWPLMRSRQRSTARSWSSRQAGAQAFCRAMRTDEWNEGQAGHGQRNDDVGEDLPPPCSRSSAGGDVSHLARVQGRGSEPATVPTEAHSVRKISARFPAPAQPHWHGPGCQLVAAGALPHLFFGPL